MTASGGTGDPSSFEFDDAPGPPPERRPAPPEPDAEADAPDEIELHPDPEPPAPDSRLTQAREAREVAEAVSRDAYRSLWAEVLRWPLKGSPLVVVVLLVLVAGLLSYFDGGATRDGWTTNRLIQIAVGIGGLFVLAIASRRILRAAVRRETRVSLRRDEEDVVPWWRVVTEFITVLAITMLPLGVYWIVASFADIPEWIDRLARPALCLLGAAQIPLALVAYTVKDSPLAAFPHVVRRVWKAEPHAARVAGVTSVACVALLLLSFAFAAGFDRPDTYEVIEDHTPLRTAGRIGLFALRFLALYAALVSLRVAGLLLNEVPEVRESLR